MPPPYLGPQELRNALSMKNAIDALDDAFSGVLPTAPPRSHLDVGRGALLLMPAWSDDLGTGVKLLTVAPDNPSAGLPLIHGVYVLFDGESLRPSALLDGAALTGIRTAAVSAVATRHLARPESRTLLVFGGGTQGLAHVEAMGEVLPELERVLCVSRSDSSAKRLVERAAQLGYGAEVASPDAVELADVVCTCTTSSSPLFDGALLRSGAHVNAVGAYKPDARELDDASIARSKVFVEVKEPALQEAGDLRLPVEAAVLAPGDVTELGDVAGGRAAGRTGVEDITVFKSVGVAFEDLVVAAAAVR
ncbi:MAG TPA: ornithine cyclodeaminase family protein [Actinomycetota bacterium]|nr:ornithine cyclodeaminase family protein [Actinomycetota bacterium]